MNGRGGITGVILSGGSAYAAYEVGVMKALFRGESPAGGGVPVDAQVFSGTSAGSLNAAWMVSPPQASLSDLAESLEGLWLDEIATNGFGCTQGALRYRADPLEFLNPICFLRNPSSAFLRAAEDISYFLQDWSQRAVYFADTQASLVRRLLELIDLSSIISTDPFRAILTRVLMPSDIRTSERQLRIAATNWGSGALKLFSNQDMTDQIAVDVIMASSAFPGLPPVYIEGEPYVDGGYVMNTPLQPAIDAGVTTVHLIYLDPDPKAISVRRLQNTIDVIDRMFVILRAAILNRDVETARNVNEGMTLIEASGDYEPSAGEMKSFVRTAFRIQTRLESGQPYRKLWIHRYHPTDDLGGVLGLLNFDRTQIANLIDRGYRDAVTHDCLASDCVLPTYELL